MYLHPFNAQLHRTESCNRNKPRSFPSSRVFSRFVGKGRVMFRLRTEYQRKNVYFFHPFVFSSLTKVFFSRLHRPFRRQKGLLRKSCDVDDGIGRGLPNASVYSLSYVSKRKEIHVLSYANSIS